MLLEIDGVRTELVTSGMKTLPVIAGAYDVFKRSFAAMVARAHCEGAPGILRPEDVAKVVVRAVRSSVRDLAIGSAFRPIWLRLYADWPAMRFGTH